MPWTKSDLAVASAEKWKTISSAIADRGKTVRLCLVLLVVQAPADALAWLLAWH